ncbi:Leucine carboxyl methyltransferase 1 [Emericellopsis cladophorae]|uniref:Leucine carboxyl methyltransferase 1 n=1 Tax=Emericellopsis cladophorae TaxID=2686198 RepID=A0A9P9Y965_9HYPO|nr:Leucine carboxyl methyltransferase 1 [Emericellopsis cladophorae]KAI6785099.1 Leucine carboxyl methyltransferase 1 [Emericellopsis cladophorae]
MRSSIPNLLTLRGRGGSRASRGRGRAHPEAHDTTIQGTDTDAAVSRLSAVHCGYLTDPYAQFFVSAGGGPPTRRLPIINRGTYTRTTALDRLVDAFLDGGGQRQIVSLGAGTDTRVFKRFARGETEGLVYHELDFEIISQKKLRIVRGNPMLSRIMGEITVSEDATCWSSELGARGEYHCHGLDLRKLVDADESQVLIPGLRTDMPTLVVSECCLCYLATEQAAAVLAYFHKRIPSLGTVIYEPVLPHDAFGKVMTANLAARGISMPTLDSYPTPADQEKRLSEAGFVGAVKAMTVEEIWRKWVTDDEKARLDSLEGLDEVEEWELLAGHYVVAWGSKGLDVKAWNELLT